MSSGITFSCGGGHYVDPNHVKVPCCKAINQAIRTYNDGLVGPIDKGLVLAAENYDDDTANLNARTLATFAGVSASGQLLRDTLRKINRNFQGKECKCCSEAASAAATAALSYAQYIVSLGANLGLPTAALTDAFAQLNNQLKDTLFLAYQTVKCEPCNGGHGHGHGHCQKDSCCAAINAAIEYYTSGLVDPISDGLFNAGQEFAQAANLANRVGSALASISQVGVAFRAVLRDLLVLTGQCECCTDAADTMAHASLDYAQYIISTASRRGVQTGNLDGVFTQLLTQLNDTINLARDTVKCPVCPDPKPDCGCDDAQQ